MLRPPRKRIGRPPRSGPAKVDYTVLDRLLVIGEETLGLSGRQHRYPGIREIARRLGVAHSLVARYCREHNCIARRATSADAHGGGAARPAPKAGSSPAPRSAKAPRPPSAKAPKATAPRAARQHAQEASSAATPPATGAEMPAPSPAEAPSTEMTAGSARLDGPGDAADGAVLLLGHVDFEPEVAAPQPVVAAAADVTAATAESLSPRPRRGRRPKGEQLCDEDELYRLLVWGEAKPLDDGTGAAVVYPSYAEVSRRLGIARTAIEKFVKEHHCEERRAEAQARVRAKVDQKLVEVRAQAISVTRERKLEIIDAFIEAFYEALQEGRVRTDSVADFNTMVRLKSFVEGGADQRTELMGGLTLDDLRSSHAEYLRDRAGDTAAIVGVIDAELVGSVASLPAPGSDHASPRSDHAEHPGDDTDTSESPQPPVFKGLVSK